MNASFVLKYMLLSIIWRGGGEQTNMWNFVSKHGPLLLLMHNRTCRVSVATKFCSGASYLMTVSMDLASCHPSGA